MSNTGSASRADPFANLGDDLSDFAPAAPSSRQRPEPEAVREVAAKLNFPSRAPRPEKPAAPAPAPKPEEGRGPKREVRRYRTGRNLQVNIKVTAETFEKLTRISNEKGWVFGQTLEHALAALEAQKPASR